MVTFANIPPLCLCASIIDFREFVALIEGSRSNKRHASGDCNARKAGASKECIIADACQLTAIAKSNAHKVKALRKGTIAQAFNIIWNVDAR